MQYIGFDYHKQYSFATKIDKETGEMKTAKLSNTPEALDSFIDDPENTHAVFESSRTWSLMYELLKDRVASVKLAHPLRVKAIASARIKTDKIDSHILAQLLAADLIPESYIREEPNREKQAILRQRAFFVGISSRIKNRIHVVVDRQPYETRKTILGLKDLFGKAGLTWLRTVPEISKNDRLLLDHMLSLYDDVTILIKKSDKLVNSLFNQDENAKLLATMPGIGKFLAVLISTEVDSIDRFLNANKLAAYTGLVPSTYSSASVTRHGKITKQGNKWLRWAFIEAAQTAKNHNAQLNEYFTRIAQRAGNNKAKTALARRMVTIAFSIWKEQRPFEEYKVSKNKYKSRELPSCHSSGSKRSAL